VLAVRPHLVHPVPTRIAPGTSPLRGSVRGRDRRHDGHQPRRREEPHRSRDGCAPSRQRADAIV